MGRWIDYDTATLLIFVTVCVTICVGFGFLLGKVL